jgi:hypothetical protein
VSRSTCFGATIQSASGPSGTTDSTVRPAGRGHSIRSIVPSAEMRKTLPLSQPLASQRRSSPSISRWCACSSVSPFFESTKSVVLPSLSVRQMQHESASIE